ncbi:conserved unknown protein [Ectocarpus siliculosus]|uniref:PhoD-like phosphatase metallophosphatase domain-containing protein n=1 Tax=Ectocarpus siliculosus TaxID=2880 RepID=D8LTV8_ECTSI|nr:conserved unknown protein [Ectocarpus siliculosus]|eukprot:CBN74005.1 conserved unknown protein [Ectocarpus siliculosus]
MAVCIDNWSLFEREPSSSGRPTPYLLGPVVGAVTETTARVLVEVATTMVVTMEAFMDGASVCNVSQEVRAKTPTVFKLNHFLPAKRVRVTVNVGEFGQEREAQFTTTSDKSQWKIASVSCNCFKFVEKVALWDRLARVAGDLDCVLHLGDQIYADTDFGAKKAGGVGFESAWESCLLILEPLARSDWDSKREDLLECYRKTYRTTWNMPAVATVLASAANYMICDDHEFVDNLGDNPEHSDTSTVEFYVAKVGYQAYCEYQMQLLRDVDVQDTRVKPFYAWKLSPKVGFFMTDNRIERTLHRQDRPDAEWVDREFMGPDQWDRIKEAFSADFAECQTVFFGTPTPLVFISQSATGVAEKVIVDAKGTWGNKDFISEQKAALSLLNSWQLARPNRAAITLGGDLHLGGFTDSWHDESDVPLHQMTASAIGNMPEKDLDAVKEMVIRGVMHADENLFAFKVKHHEWIYGPNYGMVDLLLPKGSNRPDITLTLVPHVGDPKIRNLELGSADVEVKKAGQSAASRSAHVTAKIMAVPPLGPDGQPQAPAAGGCKCACTVS